MANEFLTRLTKEVESINNEYERKRSAWGRGVAVYTEELLENLEYCTEEPENAKELEEVLLNGASDWNEYSWGGCSLIYDEDIARTLCTPSELKKTNYGERRPNAKEEWLDTQARALFQAARRIRQAYRRITK